MFCKRALYQLAVNGDAISKFNRLTMQSQTKLVPYSR